MYLTGLAETEALCAGSDKAVSTPFFARVVESATPSELLSNGFWSLPLRSL
jgi:hypothetical protein